MIFVIKHGWKVYQFRLKLWILLPDFVGPAPDQNDEDESTNFSFGEDQVWKVGMGPSGKKERKLILPVGTHYMAILHMFCPCKM